jgi:hypothetical protein
LAHAQAGEAVAGVDQVGERACPGGEIVVARHHDVAQRIRRREAARRDIGGVDGAVSMRGAADGRQFAQERDAGVQRRLHEAGRRRGSAGVGRMID